MRHIAFVWLQNGSMLRLCFFCCYNTIRSGAVIRLNFIGAQVPFCPVVRSLNIEQPQNGVEYMTVTGSQPGVSLKLCQRFGKMWVELFKFGGGQDEERDYADIVLLKCFEI